METIQVKVIDDDLEFFSPIAESWAKCVQEYVTVWDGSDLPYWYNERANVSILAGGAWRSGFTAIEEYQVEKIACEQPARGRNDIFITDAEFSISIEAKVAYPDISQLELARKQMEFALSAAVVDAGNVQVTDLKAGAAFIAPHSKGRPATQNEINDFVALVVESRVGLVAYCCPGLAQSLPSHDGKYYPLVALLLQRA